MLMKRFSASGKPLLGVLLDPCRCAEAIDANTPVARHRCSGFKFCFGYNQQQLLRTKVFL